MIGDKVKVYFIDQTNEDPISNTELRCEASALKVRIIVISTVDVDFIFPDKKVIASTINNKLNIDLARETFRKRQVKGTSAQSSSGATSSAE